ncbi:hypothetical protein BRADI_1g48810v3 [Brachypodium distachyon]|uniref:Uncharacterized protein n=1 Tax=Brachypodium distachyon TaxID=15368 RepID=I1H0V6_BRADI|nr:hypothetical protein BRADI_1g48810v3 [Brachypodium distachyon]PNT76492.1 hypothetical protein BRADI_1g48810v3 [Brachypodium distachyon]
MVVDEPYWCPFPMVRYLLSPAASHRLPLSQSMAQGFMAPGVPLSSSKLTTASSAPLRSCATMASMSTPSQERRRHGSARKEGAAVARPRRAAGQGNGPRNAEVQSPTATRFLWARRDAFLAARRHLLPAGEQRRHHVNRLSKTGSSR